MAKASIKETKEQRRARAGEIAARLAEEFPEAECALRHDGPFQLLVATILSAQCTDARVNMVTPDVFKKWPNAAALAKAKLPDVEAVIRSTGFYRNKAKSLVAMAQAVVERHGGEVPSTMDALLGLRGVARKTANVVLGTAFGLNEGIAVDTHVTRVSGRLGLTRHTDPVKIEQDLLTLFPRGDWTDVGHRIILHGRRTCHARKPLCPVCIVRELCPVGRTVPGTVFPAGSGDDVATPPKRAKP